MSDLALFVTSQRFRRIWVVPASLALAFALGLAITQFGALVLAWFAGPVLGLLMFAWPELGVYSLTFTLPIEELIPGIGTATGTRLLGMAVFGAWFLRKIIRRESWLETLKTPLVLGAVVFTGWCFISMLWAGDRGASLLGLMTQIQLILLALIIVDVVQSWEKAAWLPRLLVIGGLIAAGFTIDQYFVQGIKRAGDGISGGINFTASSLVSILPFAFYLIRSATRGIWMFLGLLYIPLGIVAVIVTFSRSSYLLLALVLVIHAWLLLRTRSRRIWVFLVGALLIIAFLVAPKDAVNERVQSISPLLEDWVSSAEDDRLQADARAFHWRVGVEMLKDSPLLGVGYGNFGVQFLIYQFDVPGTPEVFTNQRSPHSSYVGLLTELGPIGLGLFLFVLGAAYYNLIRAGRRLKAGLKDEQDSNHLYLVQALYYVFIIQILYGWALNTHMNKNFWLFLGMSVVLNRLSQKITGPMKGDSDVYRP